ncbi:MAG TPA: hypothetical protein DDW50_20965 [Firmicutes bacterium]|jgi:hypothetical protein|nr:hypothetical protein [Bacillota bacterium]
MGGVFTNTGTLQGIGSAANMIGGFYSAYSQLQQGQMQQDMNNFQADQILQQGDEQAKAVKKQGQQTLASQQAAMAANGMALDSATAEDISYDTLEKSSLDELLIKYNANVNAFQARQAGKNARTASKINAANTLMGTATQVADSWNQWAKTSKGKTSSTKGVNDYDDETTAYITRKSKYQAPGIYRD